MATLSAMGASTPRTSIAVRRLLGNVATADGSGNVTYAAPGDAASVNGFSFVSLTQAEYDALTPDANTVYLVTA